MFATQNMALQQLLHEATRHGTEEILQYMPAVYSPELEQVIRWGVRQGLLHYAEGIGSLSPSSHSPVHGQQALL
jgi:hypothetical protein